MELSTADPLPKFQQRTFWDFDSENSHEQILQCRNCGENLSSLHLTKRYCSESCKKAFYKKNGSLAVDGGHECRVCNKWFKIGPGQSNKWLCSEECRKRQNSKQVREFHKNRPEREAVYRNRTKEKICDSKARRFYNWNPNAPRYCEACGESRYVEVAHKPEHARIGARRCRENCKWPEMVWVLCPTCHRLIDQKINTPEELGLCSTSIMTTTNLCVNGSEASLMVASSPLEMLSARAWQMSTQENCHDTRSVTSSAEFVGGQKPSELQDSQELIESGAHPCPVNRYRMPVNTKARQMNGTCGQNSIQSSASSALQQSLANSLQVRMDVNGSMEFRLTWRNLVMESQRQICQLQALARRIEDSDCSGLHGWPTPAVQNSHGGVNPAGNTGEHFTLQTAAAMAGWGTPRVTTNGGLSHPGRAALKESRLEDQVHGWATPCARDWKDSPGQKTERVNSDGTVRSRTDQLPRQVHGMTIESPNARTERRGALEPGFPRWLMGFHENWDILSPEYESWSKVQDAIEKDVSKDTGTP